MSLNQVRSPRPKVDDYLRALAYLNVMVWAVLFYVFPPTSFLSELAQYSRTLWLSVAFIGGLMAFIGALARIDIKLEFPGLLLALVGPAFYTFSQFYLTVQPVPGSDPEQRIALIAYALFGVTFLLPRTVSLLREKNRLKDLNKVAAKGPNL